MIRQVEILEYLGPEASFSYEVASKEQTNNPYYKTVQLRAASTISEVCDRVIKNPTSHGVVPIENSTDGSVKDTHTAFRRHPLRIGQERTHSISQSAYYLREVDPEDVKWLISKDSALGQVRKTAARIFPNARFDERPSTVAAILEAAENREMAAIGPAMAGRIYGLTDKMIQIDNVHDNPLNTTRFLIIDAQDEEEIPKTGNDKTSLIAQIPDRPGSLYHVLDILVDQGINLAKIKSSGRDGDYIAFLMDLEGHQEDLPLTTALTRLLRQGVTIKMLGSYPKDNYLPPEIPWELDMQYVIEGLKHEVANEVNHMEKTVVAFTLADRVGALRDALEPFKKNRINLTEIDSLPTGKLGEYIFYLAFENGVSYKDQALEELQSYCSRLVLI